MKKTVSIILILALNAAFADKNMDDLNRKRMEWTKAYLEKQGSPVPDGGIKIIPEKQMSSYAENKEQRVKAKEDIKTYGYIKLENPSTEQLLNLKITIQ